MKRKKFKLIFAVLLCTVTFRLYSQVPNQTEPPEITEPVDTPDTSAPDQENSPNETVPLEPVDKDEKNTERPDTAGKTETTAPQPENQEQHGNNTESTETTETDEAESVPAGISYHEQHLFLGGVSAVAVDKSNVFFAGNDGFVTSYDCTTLLPDTWQLSVYPIKKIAVNPTVPLAAIYETNNIGIHRISVWDWFNKELVFSKDIGSAVLSLSWSGNGTYLFVGNQTTEGIAVFDAYGKEVRPFVTQPGLVMLAATGKTEKSVVTYSATGSLVYTSLTTKKLPTMYTTETNLLQPTLLKNYTAFAGVKDNTVFCIDALSGKVIQNYQANNPIFATTLADKIPVWFEKTDKTSYCIRQGNTKTPAFSLDAPDTITCASHLGGAFFIGTDTGALYMLKQMSNKTVNCVSLLNTPFEAVISIRQHNNKLYALTANALYTTDINFEKFSLLAQLPVNVHPKKFTVCKQGVFLISQKAGPVYFYSFTKDKFEIFFKPSQPTTEIQAANDKVVLIEKNTVQVLKLDGTVIFKRTIQGMQTAMLLDNDIIFIAKNDFDSHIPIMLINIATNETLPFPTAGLFAYGLRQNTSDPNKLTGFIIDGQDDNVHTDLYQFTVDTVQPTASSTKRLLQYEGEKLDADAISRDGFISTTIADGTLITVSTRGTAQQRERSYALTKECEYVGKFLCGLNYDGSISLYNSDFELIKILTISTQ